ncbi:MAG: lytic transglycosylase domain-containing protein [Lentisphaeria bacterium]|nr:lytic transglycosylase domain-containing protein [Lentisphaeria bacterium]MBQ8754323.1 lytic transglycosylase domain-containing protein [Lentisphaeria bacterium]
MTLYLQKRSRRSAVPWCIAAAVLLLLGLAAYLERNRVRDWVVDDTKFSREITFFAGRHGIDPRLVRAVIFQESRFDPDCKGSKGEVGLMQILPKGAAADYVIRHKLPPYSRRALANPKLNLEIGCWYLRCALDRWEGHPDQLPLALSQYNAGESRAAKWAAAKRTPAQYPIRSTRIYVSRIMKRYEKYMKESLKQ